MAFDVPWRSTFTESASFAILAIPRIDVGSRRSSVREPDSTPYRGSSCEKIEIESGTKKRGQGAFDSLPAEKEFFSPPLRPR